MYAIMESGGKQYRVSQGQTVKVEKIEADDGETITIDKILLLSKEGSVVIGTPYIEGASVKATVVHTGKEKKVLVFKKKPRKGFKRLKGHRQYATKVKIEDIVYGG
jgi:large subunit ribosomal protein L21